MNHKLIRAVFVAAVGLGLAAVLMRVKDAPDPRPGTRPAAKTNPLARPLACYRVYEDTVDTKGIDYRGANYKARISDNGCVIGAISQVGAQRASREFNVEFGAPTVEQGAFRLESPSGKFNREGFGLGQIERGPVTEEYLFENRRVEQLYRLPAALGKGDLRVSIPVKSDLDGPVILHPANSNQFEDLRFQKGGLAFCDLRGDTRMAYYGAIVKDSSEKSLPLVPRYEMGAVIFDIPASFMNSATYPVVLDPWLDFAGSGSGGGVSNNASDSENPSMAIQGSQPFIAWADNSAATSSNPTNTQIFMKWWNGFQFEDLGGSSLGTGISATKGKATNPSLAFTQLGGIAVSWQDDSEGNIGAFMKFWPTKTQSGSSTTSWQELGGSASGGGIFSTFTPSLHPSSGGMTGLIPGTITTDPTTGITTSTPSTVVDCPVVALDNPRTGTTQIFLFAWYPGAPAQPISAAFPSGAPAVPAGWYQIGMPGGRGIPSANTFNPAATISTAPTGTSAQYPSLVVDSHNRISIAWQDTTSGLSRIYFKTYTPTGGFGIGTQLFEIQPNPGNPLTELDMIPAGDFLEVGASATGPGLSTASGFLSQYPSLSTDPNLSATGVDSFTVAWQETEAAAPPNPGTTSQIYLSRSVGGAGPGAFGAIAGSTSTGGISHTLSHASTPSVDVNGNYIGVAWADDSNGRSSIYARRFFLGVGGTGLWDQIGFQGSAFPALNGELTAPISGISQSNNFSIQPVLKMDSFGDPIICWADGSAATFDILCKVFSPNGPGIATGVGTNNPVFTTTLRQTMTDPTLGPATDIAVAGFAGTQTNVFLSSRVFTETLIPAGTSLRLEIEVQPQDNPFTNSPNFETLFVAPDSPATTPAIIAVLNFQGLPNANYHWQARTADQQGRTSPWIIFATDSSGTSFRINLGGPTGGGTGGGGGGNGPQNTGSTSGGGSPHRSQCGLTGLEAVALLGLLRLARRRSQTKK